MPFGKPSITSPNALDLRAVREAISNTRQRIEAIEAATLLLQNAPGASATLLAQILSQIQQLQLAAGTVTSVNATVPSDLLTVSGVPFTNAGTIALALADQPRSLVFAGPVSGADAAPNFRALEWDYDLPLITSTSFTSGLDGSEQVLIERYGRLYWTTVQAIANLGGGSSSGPIEVQLSCSDLLSNLTAGTNRGYFRAPRVIHLTAVRASVIAASSSGLVTVDINVNGATILSTKLTIDANEKTSTTAATPPVISTPTISDDDEVTIDIDGAGTAARGLIVTLLGTR